MKSSKTNISAKDMAKLQELQAADFVLMELSLYLDTHPDDAEAIRQFGEMSLKCDSLRQEVEARFGPLTPKTASPDAEAWSWSQSPWPWQL